MSVADTDVTYEFELDWTPRIQRKVDNCLVYLETEAQDWISFFASRDRYWEERINCGKYLSIYSRCSGTLNLSAIGFTLIPREGDPCRLLDLLPCNSAIYFEELWRYAVSECFPEQLVGRERWYLNAANQFIDEHVRGRKMFVHYRTLSWILGED